MGHILGAEQFNRDELSRLFKGADEFREQSRFKAGRRELVQRHLGNTMVTGFYEPSTRTRISFEKAALNLGIAVTGSENAAEFSSAAKGETIEDTVRVFEEYNFQAIVLRTKEEGYAARAAAAIDHAPIINGGDGIGEHPTQAVLDMYTVHEHLQQLDNLNVVIGGDLQRGRTARSLAALLSKYPGNHISFVSTPELQIGDDIKAKLNERGTSFEETNEMYDVLGDADVVYWTRLQLERGNNGQPSVDQSHFVLDAGALEQLPEHAIIMHPLPRNQEIPASTDDDPRAKYFRQAGNGLYVRMAMLDEIMNELP